MNQKVNRFVANEIPGNVSENAAVEKALSSDLVSTT